MAEFFYALCALTAALCAVLQLRAYQRSGYRLLLWGGVCFAGLALNNGLLVVDKLNLGTNIDLFTYRLVVALASLVILLYGLIWDTD